MVVKVELNRVAVLLKHQERSMAIKQEKINSAADLKIVAGLADVESGRFTTRRTCSIPARIISEDATLSETCRILDMSASGARLTFSSDVRSGRLISGRFWLRLQHDSTQVRCQVIWWQGPVCGVRYVSPMQTVKRNRNMKPKSKPAKRSLLSLLG